MLLEMGLIAGGIPAGWALRRHAAVVRVVNAALGWTVRVMLFLLGLSIGLDDSGSCAVSACTRCSSVPFP